MSTQTRTVHYVVSSHWDREWYQTFQQFRFRLVRLLDRVLDDLASGALAGPFTCDGQAIVLRDYLEVRPERTPQVRKFLHEGKLVAGPWFVLPDEFCVSGESLVRNLRYGRELVREWGARPSEAGFVCDLFGHCSQLPAILQGFDIKAALVWRGIPLLPDARFWWEAADGSTLPAYRFGKSGYCDYDYIVRHTHDYRRVFDPQRASEDLSDYAALELSRSADGPALLFDGGDHLEPDARHYAILRRAIERGLPDGSRLMHSSLDAFVEELVKTFASVTQRVKGELRESGIPPFTEEQAYLIAGVQSSRVWIKQENAACENLLCHWAEPFSVMANTAHGAEYPTQYLRLAWDWLLQNHPHDSICGCSIDAVHEDMRFRFAQCRQIAEELTVEALRAFASAPPECATGTAPEMRVVVANAGQQPLQGVQILSIGLPANWPVSAEFFEMEGKPALEIFDPLGNPVPFQLLAHRPGRIRRRLRGGNFPEAFRVHEVTVAATPQLPALGCTTLVVRGLPTSTDPFERTPHFQRPLRAPSTPGLATSPRTMNNGLLHVEVKENGTLSLTRLQDGLHFDGLLALEDEADVGDGWVHCPPVNDLRISPVAGATSAVLHNGPLLATLAIRLRMEIPEEFDTRTASRSSRMTDLVVEHRVTLRAGESHVEIETTVHNTARDHRLRVLFPSGAKTDTFLADAAFDVVERPVALPADNHTRREPVTEARPQQSWTAVHDTTRGLAVVTAGGLLEAGVRDTPERPVLLTLFRATGRTVMTDGEPGGQLSGDSLRFRFAIIPADGAPDRPALFAMARHLASPPRTLDVYPEDGDIFPRTIPPNASLCTVSGAVLSSFRQVGSAAEIRIFNPQDAPSTALLSGLPGSHALPVNLESRPLGDPLDIKDGNLELTLQPKAFVTLQVGESDREI